MPQHSKKSGDRCNNYGRFLPSGLDLSAQHTTLVLHSFVLWRLTMQTLPRTSTTEMEVTSIRLERDLKEKLKDLSGNQGYQALIRDVLWNYVRQRSGDDSAQLSAEDIRATFAATAFGSDRCALTGAVITAGDAIVLGLTTMGTIVPLHRDSLKSA